jgi:hypothetical protein
MNPNEQHPDPEGETPITDPNDRRLYSEDGVDMTLIRWMLSLTPAERLRTLEETLKSLRWLRDGRSSS